MVLSALGLGLDAGLGHHPDARRVLLIVGAAYAVSATLALWLIDPGLRPVRDAARLRRYGQYLRGSGWLVLGAASGEVTSRLSTASWSSAASARRRWPGCPRCRWSSALNGCSASQAQSA